MERNMAKEHIAIKIKIHTLGGGSSERRKEKELIPMLILAWDLLELGIKIKLSKVNGYSLMELSTVDNLRKTNLMGKEFGQ